MGTSLALKQYTDEREGDYDLNSPIKPERNLLAAILARAICDAFGSAQCEKHIVRSARQWIFGQLLFSQPFSFAWVASHLDLDPKMLQNNLRNYEENAEAIRNRLGILK